MNIALMMLLLSAIAIPAMVKQGRAKGPLVHTVLFWLKNPDNETDRKKLLEGLNMIKEIDLIDEPYVGVPAPSERDVVDGSFDCSITFIFKDRETEERYQTHTTHLKFVEEYQYLWDRVVVYDSIPPEV